MFQFIVFFNALQFMKIDNKGTVLALQKNDFALNCYIESMSNLFVK